MTRLAALASLALACLATAPAAAQTSDATGEMPPAFSDWLAGDWADPRVHRCGEIFVRIRVEEGQVRHFTVTYGNAVPGMRAEIVEMEGDRAVILENPVLPFHQRLRYVTRNAHVLEKANGAAGVTFVRCEGATGAS